MELEWGFFLGKLLELVITVIGGFVLKKLVEWLNSQIAAANANKDLTQLEAAVKLIRQLVQAAEMIGIAGTIENIGREKKKFVIDLAEKELAARGIHIDLDVLDALIEAQVKEAIKDLEVLFPEEDAEAAAPAAAA